MNDSDKSWAIKSSSSLFDIQIKELLDYRDLLWILVRRDFVSFYKQTILGPIWFFIQPIFTIFIYSFIFGKVGKFSTENAPGPLFYLVGVICWNYFADCLVKTSSVFKDNADIFGKVYFPRLIMPLSLIFSNLIRLSVQLLLFVVLIVYYAATGYALNLTSYILLFPLLIALLAGLGLGFGMIISALTTKYRDLAFLIQFAVPLLTYTTTVVYPLSSTPSKIKSFVAFNPITPIIETFRKGALGTGTFSWAMIGYTGMVTILVLVFGGLIFNKVQKSFVDTV